MASSSAAPAPLDVEAGQPPPEVGGDGASSSVPNQTDSKHHPSLAKVVLLSSAGNVLEWMDFRCGVGVGGIVGSDRCVW